ncbi:hypothetical protein FKM82_024500 [Ascaphus truei]
MSKKELQSLESSSKLIVVGINSSRAPRNKILFAPSSEASPHSTTTGSPNPGPPLRVEPDRAGRAIGFAGGGKNGSEK